MRQAALVAALLIAALADLAAQPTARFAIQAVAPAAAAQDPVLTNTCLISSDVHKLAAFYQQILKIAPQFDSENYVEFRTGAGTLSIFDARAQETYIPGSAESSANRSAILEFRVADVDGEYPRLQSIVKTWVKPPTTQPWGTRSIYFRDPDGNLVNFFAPAKAQ
jgi:uncharacterized glyoxalase superfamily protein PhnB